jgi:hypothetical protein
VHLNQQLKLFTGIKRTPPSKETEIDDNEGDGRAIEAGPGTRGRVGEKPGAEPGPEAKTGDILHSMVEVEMLDASFCHDI